MVVGINAKTSEIVQMALSAVEAQNGLSILEVAHNNGINLEGACEGSLACSTCHVVVEKKFFDDQLILTVSSIFDIDNTDYDGTYTGSILSFEAAYTIIDNLELTVGYTNIKGDKDHPLGENYRLYIMEDFSHIRADLKYSF